MDRKLGRNSQQRGTLDAEKRQLRAQMRALRDALSPDERERHSGRIVERLWQLPEVIAAESVFVYVSYRSEVETRELIERLWLRGKIVTVPKLAPQDADPVGRMEAHRIDSWDQLAAGPLGILVPIGTAAFAGRLDICIAPGLAFTERGERLGSGRAHYDRFLARQSESNPRRDLITIGLAFDCQIVDRIPIEPHDRPLRMIVTPTRVIRAP